MFNGQPYRQRLTVMRALWSLPQVYAFLGHHGFASNSLIIIVITNRQQQQQQYNVFVVCQDTDEMVRYGELYSAVCAVGLIIYLEIISYFLIYCIILAILINHVCCCGQLHGINETGQDMMLMFQGA